MRRQDTYRFTPHTPQYRTVFRLDPINFSGFNGSAAFRVQMPCDSRIAVKVSLLLPDLAKERSRLSNALLTFADVFTSCLLWGSEREYSTDYSTAQDRISLVNLVGTAAVPVDLCSAAFSGLGGWSQEFQTTAEELYFTLVAVTAGSAFPNAYRGVLIAQATYSCADSSMTKDEYEQLLKECTGCQDVDGMGGGMLTQIIS